MTTETSIAVSKTAGYLGALVVFEYLWVPTMQMGVLTLLMVIDFATGVGKQIRIDPTKLTSHSAWLWLVKKVGTFMSIMSIALIFKGLEMDATAYIKGVISVFIMAEGYSVIQNIYAVRTGRILPEYDVISILLKKIGEGIKESIDASVKK